jgi:hypothetical protein
MAVDTRPTTLTAAHNYNLRNQGWPTSFQVAPRSNGNGDYTVADPVAYTFTKKSFYPSNADIIFYAKLGVAEDPEQLGAYSPWDLEKNVFGNTPAAKGHYILPAFDRNRQLASGISGIYLPSRDKTLDRPVSVEFFAGRVFYLMPDGEVYYSQVLTDIVRADKCYQEADPTAEDINELIATDGGYINITGIAKAHKMISIGTELVILADNGLWSISGSGDEGFSAVSQEIRKITSVGAINADTSIEAENTVFYWSSGGIYVLTQDQVTGYLTAQNISENTILSLYLDITPAARQSARGFYDEESKKIFWFYNDDQEYDPSNFKYRYNKALILDVVLQAFYTYTLPYDEAYPFISGMLQKKANSFESGVENVTDSAVQVTDDSENVTVTLTTPVTADVKLKLLTFVKQDNDTYKYTFSEFKNNTLLDWVIHTEEGVDYSSYIETGHDLAGDLIAEKEANTVYTFFKRTETATVDNGDGLEFDYPSSCMMQAKWDWADSSTSGRWSELEQVYRLNRHWIPLGVGPFDYGTEVIQTISQVRGKGRAMSIRFESETGKDFHLLGWAIPMTAMTAA